VSSLQRRLRPFRVAYRKGHALEPPSSHRSRDKPLEEETNKMKAVHEDLIRRRAYEIWELSGRPSGLDKEHWEQAENELLDAAPAIAAPTASATRSQPAEDVPKHLGQEPAARPTAGRPPERAEDTRPR
jgi:hypothetical protein